MLDDPTLLDPDASAYNGSGSTIPGGFDDPELQRELVAAIVSDPHWLAFAYKKINPRDFTDKGHAALVSIAIGHYEAFGKVPAVPVLRAEIKERFKENKALPYYLSALETTVGTYAPGMHAEEYLKAKMIGYAKHRAARRAFESWIKASDEGKENTSDILADLQAGLREVAEAFPQKKPNLYTIAQLEDEPDIVWQVEGHFPKGGTVTVFGTSGVGKSFYCLDLSLSVASGLPFLGRYETVKGNVLYICSEGVYGLKARVRAWLKRRGLTDLGGIVFSTTTHDLQDTDELDRLLSEARDVLGAIDLVVVDTLSRNFGPGDPDKNADMKGYLGGVDYVREQAGATVLSIHHTGWTEGDRERGAKCLRDYADSAILLSADGEEAIVVSCKKQKDDKPFPPYVLHKTPEDAKTLTLTFAREKAEQDKAAAEAEAATDEDLLLALVPVTDKHTEGICVELLSQKLGWNRKKVGRIAQNLLDRKVVQRGKDGSANQPYYYHRNPLLS